MALAELPPPDELPDEELDEAEPEELLAGALEDEPAGEAEDAPLESPPELEGDVEPSELLDSGLAEA